jgi:hypothetical protein
MCKIAYEALGSGGQVVREDLAELGVPWLGSASEAAEVLGILGRQQPIGQNEAASLIFCSIDMVPPPGIVT